MTRAMVPSMAKQTAAQAREERREWKIAGRVAVLDEIREWLPKDLRSVSVDTAIRLLVTNCETAVAEQTKARAALEKSQTEHRNTLRELREAEEALRTATRERAAFYAIACRLAGTQP